MLQFFFHSLYIYPVAGEKLLLAASARATKAGVFVAACVGRAELGNTWIALHAGAKNPATVAELKTALKALGQPTVGLKDALQKRLAAAEQVGGMVQHV